MTGIVSLILVLPLLGLLLMVLLPGKGSDHWRSKVIQLVTGVALAHVVASFSLLAMSLIAGPTYVLLWGPAESVPISLSFYCDPISCVMLSLVASIGWVICRFSVRYLDGEPGQARYFCWTACTLGCVSLTIVAGNLPLLLVGLLLTSVGLHQLLVHYPDRPAAAQAAATKFVFSRLGDACLLAACVVLFRAFGTLELPGLFSAVSQAGADGNHSSSLSVVGWLLVISAIFKSAQFPFHTWLPDTMEAPTPVSALMHAGVVNAGGYLLIRLSPLVTQAPLAMLFCAALAAFTAVFAAMIMLSQTSVKRGLAWSTIAQMGFMMLQCGLGAFSAALLHIVAHSLYKAHAFLSSGSVLSERAAMAVAEPLPTASAYRSAAAAVVSIAAAIATTVLLFGTLAAGLGMSPESKPGGYLLGLVLCVGLARWLSALMRRGFRFVLPGLLVSAVLIAVYCGSFRAMDAVYAASFPGLPVVQSSFGVFIAVGIAFAGLLLIDATVVGKRRAPWMQALYVHSTNGFYVHLWWRKVAQILCRPFASMLAAPRLPQHSPQRL